MKIKAGIIGATGYAGAELVRLLLNHPHADIAAVSSKSHEGKKLNEIYPSFNGLCEMTLVTADEAIQKSDVIFAALPHGLSEPIGRQCLNSDKTLIDLGADFRLENEAVYEEWYNKPFDIPEIHSQSVYCIPELHRKQAVGKRIIANPGCYPTSIALGLAPALKNELIELNSIVIDSKSGVTGAGRGLSQTTHFPDCNEAFSPYKAGIHRHTPEIEQTLSHIAGKDIKVTFVPHLLPVNRGIVSTIYVKAQNDVDFEKIRNCYESFYHDEFFVRLQPDGNYANLKNVRFSNYCDISLHFDTRTSTLIIVSAIDNMVKGAAGQAIQNMNLVFGYNENEGLNLVPPSF